MKEKNNSSIIQLDIAKTPKCFSVEKWIELSNSGGISIVRMDEMHQLEVDGSMIVEVSQDVIDFLELHTVEIRAHEKYYIINNIGYKYLGLKQ